MGTPRLPIMAQALFFVLAVGLSILCTAHQVQTPSAVAITQQPSGPVFKEFKIPTAQSGPEAIIPDTKNNQLFWFTEYTAGKIGEVWQNGTVQDFKIPETGATPVGLATDSHGNIWFADQASTGSIWEFMPSLAPSTQAFKQYFTKTSNSLPYAVVVDTSDNVWFTEGSGHRVGKFPRGGSNSANMTEYPTPTPNSGPTGMVSQNRTSYLWIVESYGNKIARFDTTTNTFQEFSEPLNLPLGIGVDINGNVWVAEHGGSSVDQFVPTNSTFKNYPTSPASVASGYSVTGPASISVDKYGRVWFVEHYANRAGRLDPLTGIINEFSIPYDSYSLLDTIDSNGNFWLTEFAANQIAVINMTASLPIDISSTTSTVPRVTAGHSLDEPFSVSNVGSNDVTVNLTGASSFRPSYQTTASEVALNTSLLTLHPGQRVSVAAVVTPDFSLSSGLYAAGLVATYGNASIVKNVFLNVNANILYQLETILPYVLIPVAIGAVVSLLLIRRQRKHHRTVVTK